MPRLTRFWSPDHPLHVIHRGNNRVAIFRDDIDRGYYFRLLAGASREHGCAIHAYVMMPNHVHLLTSPSASTSLPRTMQSLGRSYVQHFNRRHERTGTLWEGRYRGTLIDTDAYLLACMRYIELNPVRAGIVSDPAGFRWSSFRCNALAANDDVVTPHALFIGLGDSEGTRCGAYRRLFERRLPFSTIEEIREATNKRWVLGNDAFRAQIQCTLGDRRVAPLARGGDHKSEAFRIRREINRL